MAGGGAITGERQVTANPEDDQEPNSTRENIPIAALRREIIARLEGFMTVLRTRLDGIDKATEVFSDNLTRVPTETDKQVSGLAKLVDEKLLRLHDKTEQADVRYEQRYIASQAALSAAFLASQSAVNAALASAKDAVQAASVAAEKAVFNQNEANTAAIAKTEMSVAKQLESIMNSLRVAAQTQDDKITLINARLDRGEGADTKQSANHANTYSLAAIAVAGVLAVLSILTYAHSLIPGAAPAPSVVYADRPLVVAPVPPTAPPATR